MRSLGRGPRLGLPTPRVRAGALREAATRGAAGPGSPGHRHAAPWRVRAGGAVGAGRGPGWLAGRRPRPPHPGAGAGLWARRAPVSQAGFSLRLWGRRSSAAERVRPSPIRLRRRRPPARPRFPGACRSAAPIRLAVPARAGALQEGSNPRGGAATRQGCRAAGRRARRQHGKWGARGAGDPGWTRGVERGWGGSPRYGFPASLAKLLPRWPRLPSERWAGVARCGVRPGVPCSPSPRRRIGDRP